MASPSRAAPGLETESYSGDDSEEWQPGMNSDGEASGSSNSDANEERAEADLCSNGAEDSEEDDYGAGPLRFCTNCTGHLHAGISTCMECGHNVDNDAELFRVRSDSQHLGSAISSSSMVLAWDDAMTLHEEGKLNPHPERPDRLRAVVAKLLSSGVSDRCRRIPCREASKEELLKVHTPELVHFVKSVSDSCSQPGLPPGTATTLMTGDTYANEHTFKCARLAAGSAAEVAAIVARGEAPHGAAIVRPPGHHAESGMAMGFCFFNSAAVAARAAQAAGAQRVLILDWDIHHGNGTQHIFEDDPSILYMSLHRYDGGNFYPGTGGADETGLDAGEGFTVNVPWEAPGMGNGDYISAFSHLIVPIAYEFNPDLIIVSAGFDACEGDPIGECRVSPEGFAHMTALLKPVAPLVLLLEGGYNLRATAAATEACMRVMLGEQPPCLPAPRYASEMGWRTIQRAIQVQSQYWQCLRPMVDTFELQHAHDIAAALGKPLPQQDGMWRVAAAAGGHAVGGSAALPLPAAPRTLSPPDEGEEEGGLYAAAGGMHAPPHAAASAAAASSSFGTRRVSTTSDAAATDAEPQQHHHHHHRQPRAPVLGPRFPRKRQLLREIRERVLAAYWRRRRAAAAKQRALQRQQRRRDKSMV